LWRKHWRKHGANIQTISSFNLYRSVVRKASIVAREREWDNDALRHLHEGRVMYVADIIWLPHILDKLVGKHHLSPEEVEEVLFDTPLYRKVQKGHVPGEDLYAALGQTEAGRYLIIFFIYKSTREALILSARDMDEKERRQYARR
jgi:uncharacterized DUF497 family protein